MTRPLTLYLIIDYFVYLLVKAIETILNIIPESLARAFGRFLGRLAWIISKDRREAVIENLTIAFGKENSPHWIRLTALRSFEHVGLLIVEFFLIRRWSHKEIADRIIIQGKSDLTNILSEIDESTIRVEPEAQMKDYTLTGEELKLFVHDFTGKYSNMTNQEAIQILRMNGYSIVKHGIILYYIT
ncbi:MAG: Kdo2-lipid lauroyltransferase/acyltransferase [Thermodesulfobacteriota bacterium]|nr:Kdo2-lipid lauroyltransferase/acyltransferase [Thermodesulfobacteriota bacterium]